MVRTQKRFVYDVVGFGELVPLRLTDEQLTSIKRIVRKDKGDVYHSVSHFIRASIVKRIREEKTRLKIK